MDDQKDSQEQMQQKETRNNSGKNTKKTAIIAVVSALIGGGAGGGVVYALNNINHANISTSTATSSSSKPGTAKISNITVNQSSMAETAFNKVKGAVVSVINMQKEQQSNDSLNVFGNLFGDSNSSSSSSKSSEDQIYSEGSGVIYQKADGKAYIVTNNHVVAGSDKIEVILSDGTKLTAHLVGTDAVTDLAVLSIPDSKVSTVATFGNSSDIKAGESVLAIGSPLGSQYATSVTEGIISATNRTVPVQNEQTGVQTGTATVIQTDAAINPGNSGGALINLDGQVIGINSMKLASAGDGQGSVEGMGFAIPSNEVVTIINQLVNNGKVTRPALGVSIIGLSQVSTASQQSVLKLPTSVTQGVVLVKVNSNSAASRAGLKQYDVIVSIDGEQITSVADLQTQLYKHNVGDKVTVGYYQDGKLKQTVVTLQAAE